ncbi:ARF guanyl-nucleotide exchange factor [Coprinopsis cinerea okayama7|uniref:ARF guanyl-nucleotide exchange factor n=1 Tax=Coprinopsis cinerea (strain Okayama-7 / 130 / ATCC MYA-4618 / FGSC 9003) TaxID=240176 RepID=A8N1X2_COPC7|nr:ARF guanyl-nucleotide exchange factor [Coprinopsis cinerea okayama7\|eukprot:XP_001828871.2 ARF guanyl-nucleotide exchange factor [Coprinopsis cinerea okayama7\
MVVGFRDGFSDLEQDPVCVDGSLPSSSYISELPNALLSSATTPQTEVITTTTTTTTTTTQTTARLHLTSPMTSQSHLSGASAGSPRLLVVDKALPPLPRSGSVSFDIPTKAPTRPTLTRSVSAMALVGHREPVSPEAAHTAPFSSSLDIATRHLPLPVSSVVGSEEAHRSPSPQRFPGAGDGYASQMSEEDAPRRARGLSFGALSFLSLGMVEFKAKKEMASDALTKSPRSPQSSSKPLARKGSFWKRAKAPESQDRSPRQSLVVPVTSSPQLPPQLPPLPNMSSISSFGVDLSRDTFTSFARRSSTSLSIRRHSAESVTPNPFGRSCSSTVHSPDASASPASIPSQLPPLLVLTPNPAENSHPLSSSPQAVAFPQSTDPSVDYIPSDLHKRRRAQTNPTKSSSIDLFRLSIPSTPSFTSSKSSASASTGASFKPSSKTTLPRPDGGECPSSYLERVRAIVSKAELASVLASSVEPVFVDALRTYLKEFDFKNEPLDIALRKLLMEVGLPKETQQIDRVIEAFSTRYSECNPDLFTADDHAYILAFSLIMLHTDAFNKSNKVKMTKADYIKNTSLPGTFPEVLGCFYDNIVFSPFIFIEDPLDTNGQIGLSPDAVVKKQRTPSTPTTAGILAKTKVDPYYLLANGLLCSMQSEVEKVMTLEDTLSFEGTNGAWDIRALQGAFSNAQILEIEAPANKPLFSLNVTGDMAANGKAPTTPADSAPTTPSVMALRIAKAGLLNRKDDITGRGKRAAIRKWKTWSVVLTGSQLLFFRDITIASHFMDIVSRTTVSADGRAFKPDDIFSVKDAVALYDKSYTKHENTFRFILADGRQMLLQATNSSEMNTWLARINYASAFKSAGVRIRPLTLSRHDVQLTGVAAAASHLHDMQLQNSPPLGHTGGDSSPPCDLMDMLSGVASLESQRPQFKHRLTAPRDDLLDLDSISTIESAKTEQFEKTFQQVKADLAHVSISDDGSYSPSESPRDSTPPIPDQVPLSSHSRYDIIAQKVRELEEKLAAVLSELEAGMRFIRNIAILRPFQGATRAKLLNAVNTFVAAKKLPLLRVDSQRLACHILVLRDDLQSEADSLDAMKTIALDAARHTLKQHIPRMTLTQHGLNDRLSPTHGLQRHMSDASLTESFHSALDYSSDWLSEELDDAPTSRRPSQTFESPRPSMSTSHPNIALDPQGSRSTSLVRSSSFSSSRSGSYKELGNTSTSANEDGAEEAEPWNRTRAAKRVSLIRVPSTVALSMRTSHQTVL